MENCCQIFQARNLLLTGCQGLLSSLIDGTTKLLGVPALESGTGRDDGDQEQLKL